VTGQVKRRQAPSNGSLDLRDATVSDIQAAFDEGRLSSQRLIDLSLARIEAFDRRGPALNAMIHVDAHGALEAAADLDAERREHGPRSALHGIPLVVKDNIDTHDMPTTAGSVMLRGSLPQDDACVVHRLRAAGAIILGKANLSEFAAGPRMSSMVGPMRNPHDVARTPAGSSGGTGVAIAARYAQIGLGSDTGSSVRSPSTANGIVGLRPSMGLLSRDGVVPLSSSFDTVGPMARSVYDTAVALGAMVGVDPADESTAVSAGKFSSDYTEFLDARALDGARLGVARDFTGYDGEVDWVFDAVLAAMTGAGADLVDVRFPRWFLDVKSLWYAAIRYPEFSAEISGYLGTLGPSFPKDLDGLIERSREFSSPDGDGVPNPSRWRMFEKEEASGTIADAEYLAVRDHALPLSRQLVEGVFEADDLDAIVYPTVPVRPGPVDEDAGPNGASKPADIASLTGFPDLTVPAGFVRGRLPVGISFLGRAFSEGRLLALGYATEHLKRARRDPVLTPPLAGEPTGSE
jgi:amidase